MQHERRKSYKVSSRRSTREENQQLDQEKSEYTQYSFVFWNRWEFAVADRVTNNVTLISVVNSWIHGLAGESLAKRFGERRAKVGTAIGKHPRNQGWKLHSKNTCSTSSEKSLANSQSSKMFSTIWEAGNHDYCTSLEEIQYLKSRLKPQECSRFPANGWG